MSTGKVFIVSADTAGDIRSAVQKRDALGRAIATLADSVNQPVFFRDYKSPAPGAPVIMLECSEGFLNLVRKLPGFGGAREESTGWETVRKPEIHDYFRKPPAPPAPPRKPSPPRP